MHLNFSVLSGFMSFVVFFVLFRALGKFTGTYLGALISGASIQIRRYVAPGLFPQGGIVIGLALMIKSNDAFMPFSDIILNIILGATVVHELFGPIVAKIAFRKAREID